MSDPDHDSDEGDSLLATGMRFVMRPARALAGSVGVEQAAEQTVDEILAGPLPEILGRSIGEHRVIERVVAEASKSDDFAKSIVAALENERSAQVVQDVLASPAVERLIANALRPELTDRVLRSPEFERALRGVLTSPEVRHALTRQSSSLAAEAAAGARARATRLDDRLVLRKAPAVPGRYGGFATRGIGLAVDALLVGVVFLLGAALIGLVASLVGHLRPEWLVGVLMASGYLLVATVYFVGFWSTAGQTPGMRFMRVRVITRAGEPPGFWRSIVRLIGLWLAIIPCFAGFLPALVDERRRALQDFLAGTLVVYDERVEMG